MTLQAFIDIYDKENNIVLLEGKRKVKKEDEDKLLEFGKLLAGQTKHLIFRSGNASGADELFSRGVCSVDAGRMQVVVPYTKHRQKYNIAYDTISLSDINIAEEEEVIYHSKSNKKTTRLIDKYVGGDRGRYAIKAAYIIRDTVKVIGTSTINPITFGLFYDDLSEPMSGGTGHTMNVCLQNHIPFLDQSGWIKWLSA